MRLQRALARAGIASRRHSEELIAAGRVTVNGRVAKIGQSVDPERDEIRVDGKAIHAPAAPVWIILHKPAGVMTTRADPRGRKTVFDLVDDVPGLTYVGRLDYMTEGLLLLTNDGTAANRLMHPSGEVERTYVAIVRGDAESAARMAKRGVELEDGPVHPHAVSSRSLGGGLHEFEVTIAEGRKREVRRLCKALGLTVERLIRISFGPIALGDLRSGESRKLTTKEIAALDAVTEGTVRPR
jgi:23S rRNA pseudouridine2605 synthase